MQIALKLTLALMLAAACDDAEAPDFTTAATTMSTSTASTTEAPDESSSEDSGESSSSGEVSWEPMPYGPCEYDPSCHCDVKTCVSPCSVDSECPGSYSQCIDGGCYINCGAIGEFACDELFPDAAPNGEAFQCGNLNGIDPIKICRWV